MIAQKKTTTAEVAMAGCVIVGALVLSLAIYAGLLAGAIAVGVWVLRWLGVQV